MPVRQVYGKRSHVYSSKNIFNSPVRIQEDSVNDVGAGVSKLKLDDGSVRQSSRKALKEVHRATTNARQKNRKQITELDHTKTNKAAARDHVSVEDNPDGDSIAAVNICPPRSSAGEAIIGQSTGNIACTKPNVKYDEAIATQKQADAFLPADDTLPEPADTHLAPLLHLSSSPPTPFSLFDAALSTHLTITKIAEATFSQVFLLTPTDPPKQSRKAPLTPSVLKLIPLTNAPSSVKTRMTKDAAALQNLSSKPANVASEVRLLQHLSPVPGFTSFRGLHLVSGRPGPSFAAAYKAYNTAQRRAGRDVSCFPDPARKAAYSDGQMWAVIEMADAGMDLELAMEGPAWQDYGVWGVWDVFWQVACAYAKGEVHCGFETRDGHCGNVCVRATREMKLNDQGCASRVLDGCNGEERRESIGSRWRREEKGRKMGFSGLEVTVIDYTISRAEIPSPQTGKLEVAFNDLEEDPELFEGDAEEDYQYDIYRFMRAASFLDDPLAHLDNLCKDQVTQRSWRDHHPQTNIIWLHFMLVKLLGSYQRPDNDEGDRPRDELTNTESQMEQILRRVQDVLKLEKWQQSNLRSAGDLIALALREEWLHIEDVVGMVGDVGPKQKRSKAKQKTIKKQQ